MLVDAFLLTSIGTQVMGTREIRGEVIRALEGRLFD